MEKVLKILKLNVEMRCKPDKYEAFRNVCLNIESYIKYYIKRGIYCLIPILKKS